MVISIGETHTTHLRGPKRLQLLAKVQGGAEASETKNSGFTGS